MRAGHVLLFGAASLSLHCRYTLEHSLPGEEGDEDGTSQSTSFDEIPGEVGTSPEPGDAMEPADFVVGGRGTVGTWDGYLFPIATPESTVSPGEFTGSELCISGQLAPGSEQWAAVGWHLAQVINPETFEAGEARAITPGGTGVEVVVLNHANSEMRVDLRSDASGTESWCALIPPDGGTIDWSDFKKECWLPGGEPYDSVTPLSTILLTTFSRSDTSPTPFDYCVLHLGPTQ